MTAWSVIDQAQDQIDYRHLSSSGLAWFSNVLRRLVAASRFTRDMLATPSLAPHVGEPMRPDHRPADDCSWSRSRARTRRRCTTRSGPRGWATTTRRSSTNSCGYAASRACAYGTPR
jgi:hypothetical protein